GGVTRRLVRLCRVALPLRGLAEGGLDGKHGALEEQVFTALLAPAQLDDRVAAADRVGAAVQHVGNRQPAGEVAIDVDVGGVQHVLDAHHRGHDRAPLIDGVGGDVRVGVDDAWGD